MKPTARNLKTLPQGVHRLEKGVYLRVDGEKRYWFLKTTVNGKRREFGLGGIDQPITVVSAKALKLRAQIADGIDPGAVKAAAKERHGAPLFHELIDDVISHVRFTRQISEKTLDAWRLSLNRVSVTLGEKPVDEITRDDIVSVLRPWWTSRRGRDMKVALNGFFSYAVSCGCIKENPARWKENLDSFLPSAATLAKSRPAKHHAAPSVEELKLIVKRLREKRSASANAALVTILCATRLNELGGLEWDEIDEENCIASVPQARRKDKKPEPFRVPLPAQAMDVIRRSYVTKGCKYVFEGGQGKPVRKLSMLEMYRRAAEDDTLTLHGVRSTFSDWCAQNDKPFLVSEKCLMHSVGGQVFMAYQRDDLLEKRRKLLQEWADMLFEG